MSEEKFDGIVIKVTRDDEGTHLAVAGMGDVRPTELLQVLRQAYKLVKKGI